MNLLGLEIYISSIFVIKLNHFTVLKCESNYLVLSILNIIDPNQSFDKEVKWKYENGISYEDINLKLLSPFKYFLIIFSVENYTV